MIRWLWKIIVGAEQVCTRECQWETESVKTYGFVENGKEHATSTVYVLQCKTCGELKNHKVQA